MLNWVGVMVTEHSSILSLMVSLVSHNRSAGEGQV